MVSEEVVQKLRQKYIDIHPLVFNRSAERARSPGELFDILESLPAGLPIKWDVDARKWVVTDDLTQARDMYFPEFG